MSLSETGRTVVTRSQSKKLSSSETCQCPKSSQAIPKMNADDKKEIKTIFETLITSLRSDMEKESTSNQSKLTSLRDSIEAQIATGKQTTKSGLRPEYFSGSTDEDANQWLDFYDRIATINNWSEDLKLQAFPLYLKGVAGSWFLTLDDAKKASLSELKKAFKERFASGPHNWILSQQLGRRKQRPNESLDAYVIDITRLCKRLGLSDADSMRYFIEGLQGDLQVYVALQRPKNLEEAESFARMKHTINQRQGLSDNSALTKVTTLLTQISEKLTDNNNNNNTKTQAVAAISRPKPESGERRFDLLSKQIKQLQQQQRRMQSTNMVGAYDSQQGGPRQQAMSNWQSQPNRQYDQLQRQVSRLENDLRRYQNPRRPDYRSYRRNFRSIEGDPICSFCNRVGHTWRTCRQRNRDPRLPVTSPNVPPRPAIGGNPRFRSNNPQGNA